MKFRTCLAPYLLSTTSKLRFQEDASFGKTALSSRTFPAAPILSGGLSRRRPGCGLSPSGWALNST
ncbi:hypothetical protein AAIH27_35155, partial [Pseudomonas aeruginosa]|uniref:hypothetical protein n=1 Tax=Pseudomonas aeruginosa TaxID=287 RepID=UPI0031B7C05F